MKNFNQIDQIESAITRLKRSQLAVVTAHMVLQEIQDMEPAPSPRGYAAALGRCQGKAIWPHIQLQYEILSIDSVINSLSELLAEAEEG